MTRSTTTLRSRADTRCGYGSLDDNRDYRAIDTDAGPDPADETESLAEAAMIEPRSGPEAEQRAYEEAVVAEQVEPRGGRPASWAPAAGEQQVAADNWEPQSEDDFSPFAEDDAPRADAHWSPS